MPELQQNTLYSTTRPGRHAREAWRLLSSGYLRFEIADLKSEPGTGERTINR
jgi:hypothetical protein